MDSNVRRGGRSIGALLLVAAVSFTVLTAIGCSLQQQQEMELASGLNNIRAERGLAPLPVDPALAAVARTRAEDMANKNYFSHQPPDGCDFRCLLNRHGVSFAWAGEIISWNDFPSKDSVTATLNMWRGSPQHYSIITNCQFVRMGTGAAIAPDGRVYHVAVFEGASPGCQP